MTGRLVVTAARVWDGIAAEPIRDGFVLVEDGRIEAVGAVADLDSCAANAHASADTAAGTTVRVDLPTATVLPGLINAHVHLTLSGSPRPVRDYRRESRAGIADLTVRAALNLAEAVRAGVTTVRDLGTVHEVAFAVRAAVADGRLTGPRVLTSGRPLTVTGGHGHWFGVECDSAADLKVAVRRHARDGADWIKLMSGGGNLTPGTNPFAPQYSEEEVRACVAEARRLGLPVAAHAYDPESIRTAATAGVRTVEHCLFETVDGIGFDPETAKLMAAGDIAFVPTIGGALWRRRDGDAPPTAERFPGKAKQIREVFRELIAAGVPMVAGSDAGVPQRRFGDFPADLAALAGEDGIGLSPREVLVSATSGAARGLGLGDTGVLAPGRRADLLAVDGDPLRDLVALTRPRLVLAGGRRVPDLEGSSST